MEPEPPLSLRAAFLEERELRELVRALADVLPPMSVDALRDEGSPGCGAGHAVVRLVRGRRDLEARAWAAVAAIVERRQLPLFG